MLGKDFWTIFFKRIERVWYSFIP